MIDCTDLRTHLGGNVDDVLLAGTCPYCGGPVLPYQGDNTVTPFEEVRLQA